MWLRDAAALVVLSLLVSPCGIWAYVDNVSAFTILRGATGMADEAEKAGREPSVEGFDGAVRLNYPLEFPLGTGGLTPQIALCYSSLGRRNSWVGYGWNLDLGAIQRSLKEGTPSYDDAIDVFLLDGEELIETSPGEFRSRRELFLRIRRVAWDGTDWSLDPNGDTWEVVTRDGKRTLYGVDAESRIQKSAGPVTGTFAGLTAQIDDPNDNAVEIRYDRRDPGVAYLKTVRYGLRRNGPALESLGGTAESDRVVECVLESSRRSDPSVDFLGRVEQRLEHRLDRIDVKIGESLYRRYDLVFGEPSPDSRRSLLREVKEYGSDADAVSHRFEAPESAIPTTISTRPRPPAEETLTFTRSERSRSVGRTSEFGWWTLAARTALLVCPPSSPEDTRREVLSHPSSQGRAKYVVA